MNIHDFENEIDPKILSRGKAYFSGGAVLDLEETENLCYEATVEGTDDYAVSIFLNENGEVVDLFCDCPYDFGDVCKHEVAVLLAIRNQFGKVDIKKPHKSKTEMDDLKNLLQEQTKEVLVGILYSLSKEDCTLRKSLLLKYSTRGNEFELSRKLIQEHIRRHKKRGYIEWNETDAAMAGAWEVLNRAESISQPDCVRAVQLCFVVLSEVLPVLDYCDDSNGDVGGVISNGIEIVRKIVFTGQNSFTKAIRDELFGLIFEESKRKSYKDWSDCRLSLLKCLMPMAGDPALYQKLWYIMEDERNGCIECGGYYEKAIALLQYELLKQWESEEKGHEFLLAHLQYRDFRRKAIDEAMERSDYEAALRYAQDGLEKDEGSYGYIHEWRVATFEAYKAMGDTSKMRELAEHFVKHERDGMDYYSVLKDTTPLAQWPDTLRELLVYFDKERYSSTVFSKILILEKDFERLLLICRRNISKITEFGALFPREYKQDVEQLYRSFILEQARIASDRSMYKKVCHFLKDYGRVCGNDVMNELVQKIKSEHPRQPAFLDELGVIAEP